MAASRSAPSLRRYLRHGMLPQLVTLDAVLRLGSATRAAEALCIAQPTLSGHLRKLGEALGVPLFEQQGRHLVPTEEALLLAQASHEIFDALQRCEAALAGRRPGLPAGEGGVQQRYAVGSLQRRLDGVGVPADAPA